MQTIIKASQASDFLALVPQLVGFRPERSIVLVAFKGNRTCGAMRVDQPKLRKTEFHRKTATTLVGMFCKITGVDGVVPVIYTDATFESAGGVPHPEFASTLVDRLRFSGFLVREALCVAQDGWGSYLDESWPARGRPLGDISESDLLREAQGTVERLISPEECAELPPADLAGKESVAQYLGTLQRFISNDERQSRLVCTFPGWADFFDPILVAEDALRWDALSLSHIQVARLLVVLQAPPNRDQVMLQFAFGLAVGIEAYKLNRRFLALQKADGRSMDEIVADELAADRTPGMLPGTDFDIGELMMGQTRVRPDLDRVRTAIALLKLVVALAPLSARPAPLCMLAWLSWALGRGSVAGIFIDPALQIDSKYGMARLLETMLNSGHLPEWAYNQTGAGN